MKFLLYICFALLLIPKFSNAQIIPSGLSEDSIYFDAPTSYSPSSFYSFYYYKPSTYNPLISPILFAIHGDGGNGAGVINLIDSIAERRGALVVAPNMQTSGSWHMQEATYFYEDSTLLCGITGPATAIFKLFYRRVLQRENRASIPSYLMGFSAGGQFTTRYMLIRQAYPDSIPLQMAVSINPAYYTFPTDTFNGAEMPWPCGLSFTSTSYSFDCAGANNFFNFNCPDQIKQYYNENYAVLIGTADTLPYGGGCMNDEGANRYERAFNFYNFADSNAVTLGTTLKWEYVEIPGIAHYEYGMYNTKANSTDTSTIAESLLFDTPHHTVPSLSPHANFYVDSNYVGAYSTIQFTNTSTGATNYLWDFGDSTTSTLTNPSHSYVTAGVYTVQLYAINANGCNSWMLKRYYITVTGSHNGTLAEFQKIYWTKYGAGFYDAHQNRDSGYISLGTGSNPLLNSNSAMYLVKIKPNGDTLWTKLIGGAVGEECYAGRQTSDGGLILAGTTRSGISTNNYISMVKADSVGNVIWSKAFANGGDAYSVKQTPDNGFILFGTSGEAILIRTDVNGDTLWTKRYHNTYYGYDMSFTDDGGYILTGQALASSGANNVFLIKTDSNGDTLWSKLYGGSGYDQGQSVLQTSDHGYIISGSSTSFNAAQAYQGYIIKTDSIGNVLWSKTNNSLFRNVIRQLPDSGFIIAGYGTPGGAAVLIRVDSNCNFLWAKTYAGTSYFKSIDTTNDGGYIASGMNGNFAYLVKTDSLGNSSCLENDTIITFTNVPTVTTDFHPGLGSGCYVQDVPMVSVNGSHEGSICTAYVGLSEVPSNQNSMHIYPNPTAGAFTIITDKLINNGWLEMYSSIGKIVLRKKVNGQSMVEVHPETLSFGMYFIRVYDGLNSYLSKIIIQ